MSKGFSLVELLIALVIFFFVLFALQGLFSTVWTTQFRAIAMKKLADNTRIALEIMGREMRLAGVSDGTAPAPCDTMPSGQSFIVTGGSQIRFIDFTDKCITYTLNGNVLEKQINSTAAQSFLGGASGAVRVSQLAFVQIPDPPDPDNQPRILITMEVRTDDPTAQNQELTIALQTMVSQRELNVP